ncbi:hypothetical protein LEP1GSC035_0513 [Leptospira noguchii str. 2007001578]|uniref:Uncharacterized protein n=1 Tax=Leptospira noguchii str. 2007001578 TaxID=1049974 RepID=A0ABP2T2H1_9LEPT|nr:hypothetical protein LEP1GSC035_0513 [Leptospira noguchii str. 2007001578]
MGICKNVDTPTRSYLFPNLCLFLRDITSNLKSYFFKK